MTIEVAHERRVARIIVLANAWCPLVLPTRGQRRRMELIDRFGTRCREREMEPATGRRRLGPRVEDRDGASPLNLARLGNARRERER